MIESEPDTSISKGKWGDMYQALSCAHAYGPADLNEQIRTFLGAPVVLVAVILYFDTAKWFHNEIRSYRRELLQYSNDSHDG
jgi:hypothetical protein